LLCLSVHACRPGGALPGGKNSSELGMSIRNRRYSGMAIAGGFFAASSQMRSLAILFVLLSIADALISQFLTRQGLGQEINPFLQTRIGRGDSLLLKGAGALVVALILLDAYRRVLGRRLSGRWALHGDTLLEPHCLLHCDCLARGRRLNPPQRKAAAFLPGCFSSTCRSILCP
jgi:hypothetical protein